MSELDQRLASIAAEDPTVAAQLQALNVALSAGDIDQHVYNSACRRMIAH